MADGLVNLLKPPGMTSHDAVSHVRRCLGLRRVGHGGTLDPLAAGVLPVLVGQATRLSRFVQEADKVYRAEAVFGAVTDTYDAAGTVVREAGGRAPRLSREAVASALAAFRGSQAQRAPLYSAVRVGGERLHRRARRGEVLATEELPVRRIHVYSLRLLDWQGGRRPRAWLHVRCSKGTYIRSLVHDLGRALGTGAYLGFLVRTRAAGLELGDGWTPGELAAAPADAWVLEARRAVAHLPWAALSEAEARAVRNGQQPRPRRPAEIRPAPPTLGAWLALLQGERLAAVARRVPVERVRGPVFSESSPGRRTETGEEPGERVSLQLECVLP